MKKILTLLIAISSLSVFAQQEAPKSGSKKIDFKNVSVISPTDLSYKTLEIRYKEITDKKKPTITIDGKEYKQFTNKKAAIDTYEKEKDTAEKVTVYYVDSADKNKRPEVMTVKIAKSAVVTP